ncbi:aspartate carbamoyltransferase [Oribacterium sp. NK2B42]|uniref:aspartate carbamoyltransferase n=1 Tax=Oribacterium sp. NK2B42 TaxID=689781 RepID=UPI00040BEAD6|nr:aspartate carbamoyltransferase [Oribacterium sp. NK2B42]
MQPTPRSIINILDLTVEEIDHLMDLADDIEKNPEIYQDKCAHKQLATLFYEPSTRTRLSFESAMLALGGQILGFAGASSSSAAKGESVADTISVMSNYVDIMVMRHPKEGAPVVASMHTTVPFINAGDGGHFHPTQTLADVLTIRRTRGSLSGITLGLCGDLKFGRTVHSLIDAMLRYPDNKYILISPEELKIPEYELDKLKEAGVEFEETTSLEEAIPKLDILYMTRVQKERFFNEEDYLRLKDIYILTPEKLKNAKPDMAILHPLPRVNEISVAVDKDERAKYFYQTLCGKQMRMALILFLLGLDK